MWIIPNNHPLYSAFAQECVASKEDLKEQASDLIGSTTQPQLMWKSKHSSIGTWLNRWNRVYWLPRLFGRTLKPSIGKSFEEKLTSYLADIHASPLVLPDNRKESKTPDTYGLTLPKESVQYDLWGASLKTSVTTLTSDMKLSGENYKKWVMKLGKESIQRKKLARLTEGTGCLSSPLEKINWLTPKTIQVNETYDTYIKRMKASTDPKNNTKTNAVNLNMQVKMNAWATPTAMDFRSPFSENSEAFNKRKMNPRGVNIVEQLQRMTENQWPTPTGSDGLMSKKDLTKLKLTKSGSYRYEAENGAQSNAGLSNTVEMWPTPLLADCGHKQTVNSQHESLMKRVGQQDPDKTNITGSRPVLNPAWVLCLMGTTIEKTFCEWQAMELLNKQQK